MVAVGGAGVGEASTTVGSGVGGKGVAVGSGVAEGSKVAVGLRMASSVICMPSVATAAATKVAESVVGTGVHCSDVVPAQPPNRLAMRILASKNRAVLKFFMTYPIGIGCGAMLPRKVTLCQGRFGRQSIGVRLRTGG